MHDPVPVEVVEEGDQSEATKYDPIRQHLHIAVDCEIVAEEA